MSTNSDFGFELLNRLYDEQLMKKEDVLILLLHWYLIKNGFKCLGLGDTKTFSQSETGSELLPEGWSKEAIYKLRYLKENRLYIIIGTKSDADLLINLMKVDDTASSNLLLPVDNIVKEMHGSLETLVPTYRTILDQFKTDLLDPVYTASSKNTSTQTHVTSSLLQEEIPVGTPRYIPVEPRLPLIGPRVGHNDLDPLGGLGGGLARPRIGHDDLDPLHRGGGGMLFNPFDRGQRFNSPDGQAFFGIPGRVPPGSVPPGARFDPYGPPRELNPHRRLNPDNDNLPPPGYDDMFM